MARKRSNNQGERDSFHITSPSLLTRTIIPDLLSELEDRRTFNPAEYYPKALVKDAAVIGIEPVKRSRSTRSRSLLMPDVFRFNKPNLVALCVRRKSRRETLFALRKTGKGSRMVKRRRNKYSDISCK